MNPLSHSRITQAYSGEVGQAISTVENLKDALFPLVSLFIRAGKKGYEKV